MSLLSYNQRSFWKQNKNMFHTNIAGHKRLNQNTAFVFPMLKKIFTKPSMINNHSRIRPVSNSKYGSLIRGLRYHKCQIGLRRKNDNFGLFHKIESRRKKLETFLKLYISLNWMRFVSVTFRSIIQGATLRSASIELVQQLARTST